jgi:hypothetical protein
MSMRPLKIAAALLVSSALTFVQVAQACATGSTGGGKGTHSGGHTTPVSCPQSGGVTVNKPVTINKSISINKPVTITKDINIYKPVTIDKSINIDKTINIDKSVNITKNIDASKNINIDKTIIINKGGSSSAEASAWASAWASASASSSASASVGNIVIYSGYNEYITVNNKIGGGGEIGTAAIGTVHAGGACEMQDATVIKAVHAVCVSPDGREFPASHMTEQTWIDSGFEGEVLRCIPGAHLKVVLGDVLQSDQGMAGTFASGASLECAPNEALRHFKDGMLKCTPKVAVKDCTERTNLRRWGTGDVFFSFRTKVCAPKTAAATSRELELSGMSLTGGVGDQ